MLELRNPRHLNAEDDSTLPATEVAVDLALLDPEIEIGVFRGGVVEHPRYAGRRIFGAGINLTLLYQGAVSYLFYIVRDLGYVNKLYRGLSGPEPTEMLWIGAVETYAIGGACQLLHVMDHVIAERGARLFLPARKEGIIPGASNLRLPRAVGARLARQAILSGREFVAGTPEGDLLVDETVEREEVDAAIEARIEALTSSGLVNAAANRRALRVGEEPLDTFREYMALYCREQAPATSAPRWWRTWSAIGTRSSGESEPGRAAGAAARAAARARRPAARQPVAAGRAPARRGRRRARGDRLARRPRARCRSPRRPTCASTTRSACSPSRASSSCACTPRAAPAASRRSSATRPPTSSCGPT